MKLDDLLDVSATYNDNQKRRLLIMAHNYPSDLLFNEIDVLKKRLETLKRSEAGMYDGDLYKVDIEIYENTVYHVCKSIQLLEGLLGVSNSPHYLTMFNLYFAVKRRILKDVVFNQPVSLDNLPSEDVLLIEMFENQALVEYDELGSVTWLF